MKKNLLSFLTLMFVLFAQACSQGYDTWDMCGWGHMMGWGGSIMWLIFLIILVVAVYLILETNRRRREEDTTRRTPQEILKERYAKGEISKETYEQMKKDLES